MSDINMEIKQLLAWALTAKFHGSDAADAAQVEWERIFKNRGDPDDIPAIKGGPLLDIVSQVRDSSKTEARRLILSGGVKLNGNKIFDTTAIVYGGKLKIGKRHFVRVEP